MDLMMRLKGREAFRAISEEFKTREEALGSEGLPLDDFVEIMLKALPPAQSIQEKEEAISGLIDLFNDIDINGDGTLEFSEFTSYCVDAGMVATRVKVAPLKYQYMKNKEYVDRTTQGVGIEKIKWFPELKRAIVVETKSNCVKVYTPDFKTVHEVYATTVSIPNPSGPILEENYPQRKMCATDVDLLVQDAEFIAQHKYLVVATSNLMLTFYDTDHYVYCMDNQTPVAQTMVRWCETANLLFTSGNNHVLYVWRVDAERASLFKTIMDHHDTILDVLAIPQYDVVVTCDLKHFIYLWDIQDCRPRGKLVGHIHGVRQMVFSSMNDMLLTAGFEFDAFGWDISSKQIVMTLSGHRAPLIGIQLARFHTERAMTADLHGVFKVWNIHRLNGTSAQVLESFSTIAHCRPRSFVTLFPRRDIVAGGSALHIFESIKIQKHDEIPIRAFYHHGSNQFLGVTETYVNMWDGSNGALIEEFTGLTQSTFLNCCQDSLSRKLITATENGEIEVYNSTNLARVRKSKGCIGRICALHYDSKNKLIIATTSQSLTEISTNVENNTSGTGGIHIFDDSTVGECVFVRSLTNIQVENSAFSFNASLVATVSNDACIRLWDYETLQLQATCLGQANKFHLVEFVDPYPVVLAADTSGTIMLFVISPCDSHAPGSLLHSFVNKSHSRSGKSCEEISVVTSMACLFDGEMNKHILVTGDENGVISLWNLSAILESFDIRPIPEGKLKHERRGYHCRCKFVRVYGDDFRSNSSIPKMDKNMARKEIKKLSKRPTRANIIPKNETQLDQTIKIARIGDTSAENLNDLCDTLQLHSWIAHLDTIHSIQSHERPNILLSCSFDGVICVWDWQGNCLGHLTTNECSVNAQPWTFAPENLNRERERRAMIAQVMRKLELSTAERENIRNEKSKLDKLKINPLLQTFVEGKHTNERLSKKYTKVRKRLSAGSAHDHRRHLSLIQVGPLIPTQNTLQIGSDSENGSGNDGLDVGNINKTDRDTKVNVLTSSRARLDILQNHENLVARTDKMYPNYKTLLQEHNKPASIAQCERITDADINPSPFLRQKLGVSDVLTMNHSVFALRPNTAPASKVELPLCNSKQAKSTPNLERDSWQGKSSPSHPSGSTKMHEDGSMTLMEGAGQLSPAATAGKMKTINEIISKAVSPSTSIKSTSNLLDFDRMSLQEQMGLKERYLATQKRHDRVLDSIERQTLFAKTRSQLAAQKKLEKERRTKRYMAQKRRDGNSRIGSVLRHTSMLLSSQPTKIMSGAKTTDSVQRFGIYSIKEVMVIIRLFWSLDTDNSGTVCESELMEYRGYFEKMGYTDMSTMFQSIDSDGSGDVTLEELLRVCFMYATPTEIRDMVTLEKLGRAPAILTGDAALSPDQLADMREIFNVFDRDHSGTVSFEEVLEALHCKQDNIYEPSALSVVEIRNMYQAEDRDGNKELDFEEFVHLLRGLYGHTNNLWIE
ncbi:hypothetical protein Ae201684_016479 [Aphanomyces euteiches]|uniref:EF-hand domain-containing protein n=1 Tax=Aphanomyces euteiches TaxID=100861 RepID=A0A6G0WD76_9STRA|nr:hypothetical protein Ae201684_016479 [Aphanomyces euteiches]